MPRVYTPKVDRICEQCQAPFQTYPARIRQGKGRFCSSACRAQAVGAARTGNPRKPNYRTCEQCGKQFHCPPSLVRQGQGKHCSRACYAETQSIRDRINTQGYRWIRIDGRTVPEHRHVWEQANGEIPPGYVVHHVNGVKTDNRLANLQLMTRADHVNLHRR